MKRLTKIFVNLLAVLLIGTACFGMAGCVEKITTLKVNVQVYNYTEQKMEDVNLKVDLYGHLAPKTVETVISYVKAGLYDNTIFYKIDGRSSQIMLGEVVDNDGEVEITNKMFPTIDGEFERSGVKGSNLLNEKGVIGLWRSWTSKDSYTANDYTAMNSGKATWYMPTSSISAYNSWFCVFAKIDLEDEDTSKAFDLITNAFTENTEEYVVYYTGEYDADKADENHGLTAHLVKAVDFEETDYFKAEKEQLVCYNKQEIQVPVFDGDISAKVVSITVGK